MAKDKREARKSNIPLKDANQNKKGVLIYHEGMTVSEVATGLGKPLGEIIKKLMFAGIMATQNQTVDRDTVELIAMEYDTVLQNEVVTDVTRFDEMEIKDDEKDLKKRPAVVTIMGHVDHGKTTLLDYIRQSKVVASEAGGITQHIGAYQVQKDGRLITFIDTPGHAAFTEMRARGAQVTDIVILVVAADDGMMPQTKEAIEHAQAAGVPIIVAINKMDKPTANPDRVKQELMSYNLIAEEWGGDTIFVPISALTGKGVDDLLEMVILVSDMKEFKANPNRLAVGTVIEARLDKGRGPVATLLVQNGTLRVGDNIVVGTTYGRIRAMQDELGKIVKVAGPAKPVEITGIADVPFAGEKFMALEDERKARAIAEVRAQNKFNEEIGANRAASLNDIMSEASGELKVLNLIIKCDVQGSIEAIRGLVDKIQIEGTKINIISARVGGVTDNDISLAIASRAIIVGFNIRPTSQISDLAKEKKVEIRLYNIIYKLQEDIEKAAKGMLDPVFEEKITGEAEVRELFKISRIGTIAGSMVTKGEIRRGGSIRVIRDSIVVYTGKIAGLRRFKDDVKEVKEGYDCGITIEHYNDIKVGDRLECFVMEETERE
jgi:translation initiation factor IF-2